jgi:hypothetical protein
MFDSHLALCVLASVSLEPALLNAHRAALVWLCLRHQAAPPWPPPHPPPKGGLASSEVVFVEPTLAWLLYELR